MTWTQAIQFRWPFAGRPERRSESQLDGDLDDEFAFHLEMKMDELIDAGHTREDAHALARASFGDIEQMKRRCKRIALEDRIMLQRIHLTITILLALALVLTIGLAYGRVVRERELAMQDRHLAEAARVQADDQRARAEAVQAFLREILTKSDPANATTINMKELLDNASQRIDREFADDPAVAAELRRTIEEAKKKLNEGKDGG